MHPRYLSARSAIDRLHAADAHQSIEASLTQLSTWLVAEGRFSNRRQAAEALREQFYKARDLAPPVTRLVLAFVDLQADPAEVLS